MYTHRRNECMFFESYVWDTLFAEQKYIGKVFLVNIYKTYFNLSYKILSLLDVSLEIKRKVLLVYYVNDSTCIWIFQGVNPK